LANGPSRLISPARAVTPTTGNAPSIDASAASLIERYLPHGGWRHRPSCEQLAGAVQQADADNPDKAVDIVVAAIQMNPDCACGIVRGAILGLTPPELSSPNPYIGATLAVQVAT